MQVVPMQEFRAVQDACERFREALTKIDRKAPQLIAGNDPGGLLAMELGQIAHAALEQSVDGGKT